jgi:hypothetical protein
MAVVAGLLATGFLEPFLDEYRLATLFGVSLGMLRVCVTSMGPRPPRSAARFDVSAGLVAGDT